MARFLTIILVAGAPTAWGQRVEAVTHDGGRVVLFESGLRVHADSAWSGLRSGDRVVSATDRFAVHVPPGWRVEPPTGGMLQGEFLLIREVDGLYVSPAFVEVADPSQVVPLAQALVAEVFSSFVLDGGPADGIGVGPIRRTSLDGRLVIMRSFRGGEGEGTFSVAAISAPSGIVLVIGLSPRPVTEADWDEMVRRVEIVDPR